jgi:hypothetical protein
VARTRLYRNGVLEAEDFPPEEISGHLHDDALTVWLDLGDPTEADLALVSAELGCTSWRSRTPCTCASGPRSTGTTATAT